MDEIPIRTEKMRIVGAIGLILLISAGLGYYGYRSIRAPEEENSLEIAPEQIGGNASSVPAVVDIEGSGKYTVEAVPPSESDSIGVGPQLRRPVIFSSVFSPEARQLMTGKIDASIAVLEKDPRNFDEWMQLALLRKTVDDYEGAREIWEFLTRMKPEQPGPYANLAALYTYELKDPALAEQNFILAIQKGPKELSVYRNAYDFYRYVREDDRKAKEILQDGIKETQSQDLQYLLDHYTEL